MTSINWLLESFWPPFAEPFFTFCSCVKHFQILSVSSAPTDATAWPSGDMAIHSTRDRCPCSSATRVMAGYFQIVNWLLEKPWPDRSSLYCRDHKRPLTWRSWTKRNPLSTNSRSRRNFSFQFMVSYVWYSMEKLAGDPLFGLKLVKLSILPTLFTQFV